MSSTWHTLLKTSHDRKHFIVADNGELRVGQHMACWRVTCQHGRFITIQNLWLPRLLHHTDLCLSVLLDIRHLFHTNHLLRLAIDLASCAEIVPNLGWG